MYAVQLQEDPSQTSVAPGPIANLVGGTFGLIIIVIAVSEDTEAEVDFDAIKFS